MLAGLQSTDHRTLLLGRHAPEDIMLLNCVDECLGGQVLGQVACVHEAGGHAVGRRQSSLGGQRANRCRVVARNDTHVHALRTEVVERLGRVFAQILLQDHNRGNLAGLRQLIVHDSRIRADKCDDAGSATREATHPLQQSRVSSHGLVDDDLGGTQDP